MLKQYPAYTLKKKSKKKKKIQCRIYQKLFCKCSNLITAPSKWQRQDLNQGIKTT